MGDNKTMIGKIVDLPIEEFKVEIAKQKLNVGTLKNLSISFASAFHELGGRKDNIINQCVKGILDSEDTEVKKTLEGIYLEMMKIEEKSLHVNKVIKRLQELGN